MDFLENWATWDFSTPGTCPLRIDMLSDSTRDRCPSEASAHWRSTLGSSETIRSDNRSALTSSNSEWFRSDQTDFLYQQ